ncbi:MAG TPA: hypothetical protein VGH44_05930 [Candidatus Saccharimonadia bacterium]|jgi:hypothetical protein
MLSEPEIKKRIDKKTPLLGAFEKYRRCPEGRKSGPSPKAKTVEKPSIGDDHTANLHGDSEDG